MEFNTNGAVETDEVGVIFYVQMIDRVSGGTQQVMERDDLYDTAAESYGVIATALLANDIEKVNAYVLRHSATFFAVHVLMCTIRSRANVQKGIM
jgi:hypothetical protein